MAAVNPPHSPSGVIRSICTDDRIVSPSLIHLSLLGVTGDWKTAALDPGAWYNTVQEGGCRFMAAWVREEENASNQRQKKRDAEEADKVEVAPGVTSKLKTFSNRVDWANPRTP